MREFLNHKFYIVERVREDEMNRGFLVQDHAGDTPIFIGNVMFCSKYHRGVAEELVGILKNENPNEEYAVRLLEVDFDIKQL